ncbi:MAG: hypothetical protein LW832_00560 [Parachlamydia sp.]|jgi:chromosome segregation ATPase|nr:hypothetical protein [Parachlamydia sp.]
MQPPIKSNPHPNLRDPSFIHVSPKKRTQLVDVTNKFAANLPLTTESQRVQKLMAENQELEQTLQLLKEEFLKLREVATAKGLVTSNERSSNEQIESLEQKVASLTADKIALDSFLKNAQSMCLEAQDECDSLNGRVSELEKLNSNLRQTVKKLKADFERVSLEAKENEEILKQQANEHEKSLKKMEAELQNVSIKAQQSQELVNSQAYLLKTAESKLGKKETHLEKLKIKNKELAAECLRLQEQIQSEDHSLCKKCTELEAQVTKLQSLIIKQQTVVSTGIIGQNNLRANTGGHTETSPLAIQSHQPDFSDYCILL